MNYSVKKVIPVDHNLSAEECGKILVSDNYCLGILDENRDVTSYVLREDLLKILQFGMKNFPVDIISTLTTTHDVDLSQINEAETINLAKDTFNRAFFVGSSAKSVKNLVIVELNREKDLYFTEQYEENIPLKFKSAIKLISEAADKISLPVYLIGGVVRDIILGKKSFDMDITVEENAIEFSKFLRREYPDKCKIKELHEEFKTAKVVFNVESEDVEIDIASTRKEAYAFPASLPSILEIGCSIDEDISRRDFSINSMALCLNRENFCKLVDPFNGYSDIEKKIIKVLHPVSFVDDPTRIIRALKFSVRFDFQLDETTEALKNSCLFSGLFDSLGGERTKSEIRQTFNVNKGEALERFISEKIYYLIDKAIPVPENYRDLAHRCESLINEYCDFLEHKNHIWLIYLGVLFSDLDSDRIIEIAYRMHLSGLETEILLGAKSIYGKKDFIKTVNSKFDIYEELEGYFSESILTGLILCEDENTIKNMDLYLKEIQNVTITTTGKTLIENGFTPGPIFGEILRDILKAKINGEISTKEEEIKRLEKFFARKSLRE